jgi:hypothetical protein
VPYEDSQISGARVKKLSSPDHLVHHWTSNVAVKQEILHTGTSRKKGGGLRKEGNNNFRFRLYPKKHSVDLD